MPGSNIPSVVAASWMGRMAASFPILPWLALIWLTAGGFNSQAEDAPPATLREVVIVFKTHFDIGYTDFASNVVSRYRTSMIDAALNVVDQNAKLPADQQFVWTIPGWPATRITMDWPGQTPDRHSKILKAFTDGRFVVHGLPFTTHTEVLEMEELVRALGYSASLCSQLGLPLPRDAKMTDVPSHTWLLPTVLKQAGIDFLHLGCNAASSSPQVPLLYWWQGPDGSRLLTMYSAAGYGTGLMPPKDWTYRAWLALIQTGDNHGPPTPDEVQKLLAEAAQKMPGVKVKIGRLSDFYDVMQADKTPIPIIRGDMPDTWIHGPMCDPAGMKVARQVRPLMMAAESLNTHLQLWGVNMPSSGPSLAAAWEKSLLYGEHTWGGALYWITKYSGDVQFDYGAKWRQEEAAGRFKKLEDSWAEHSSYIYDAQSIAMPLLETNLHVLARVVAAEGKRIVVYNPLPWKRDGIVTFTDPHPGYAAVETLENASDTPSPRRTRRSPGGRGAAKPVEPMAMPVVWNGQTGSFIAKDVPPMGYLTYVPSTDAVLVPSSLRIKDKVIENHFFRLTLDPASCSVQSVIDKATGRELVDTASGYNLGQYLYERFDARDVANYVRAYVKIDADWATNELGKPNLSLLRKPGHQTITPKNGYLLLATNAAEITGSIPSDDLACTATMVAQAGHGLPNKVTSKVILYRDLPYIDIELTVHDKPADPWPEAGWMVLPFRIDKPQFRVGRPGSIIDPAVDIIAGANRNFYAVNTSVALFNEKLYGAGFCSLDAPLVSLGQPGCWQYSHDYVPQKPAAYVNLFNNQWSTNFRLWNSGTWKYRVRVWAVGRYEPGRDLINPALDARYPLQAYRLDAPAGRVPVTQDGIAIDRKGMLVTALTKNTTGHGFLLRLWELSGQSGTCEIKFPRKMQARSLQMVDLRGKPIGSPFPVKAAYLRADHCVVPIQAHAPITFMVETRP